MENRTGLILLLTHGSWGEELITAAEMIVGKIPRCTALGIMPEDALSDYMEKIEEEIKGKGEVIILADLNGGSPSNIASVYAKRNENIFALCGLSLEMLISVSSFREEYSGKELIEKVLCEVKEKCVNLKE